MKKILLVFGTRPEAIKMAPLVKEFQRYPEIFDTKVCVTAQHRRMLDQVLEVFDIQPEYDLNIMSPNQDLYDITSKVLLGMREVFQSCQPDVVFVHGDTTTSTATAIAAFYQQIPVAHVEAGLRTYNIYAPWPEEMNRQLTDRLCSYCFAPTATSQNNLLQEKIDADKIFVTGNTVIDALLWVVKKINSSPFELSSKKSFNVSLYFPSESDKNIFNTMECSRSGRNGGRGMSEFPANADIPSVCHRRFILVTGHRRENFGEGFLNICRALKTISQTHPDIDIIYPVHLNPNVQKPVYDLLADMPNIYLLPPVDYLPFVYLMQNAYLILTDSGGVQEEAPSLGKPVLVMRDTTERPEAVTAGTVKLVGTDTDKIIENVNRLIEDSTVYDQMSKAQNPYGDGKACERIVNLFLK